MHGKILLVVIYIMDTEDLLEDPSVCWLLILRLFRPIVQGDGQTFPSVAWMGNNTWFHANTLALLLPPTCHVCLVHPPCASNGTHRIVLGSSWHDARSLSFHRRFRDALNRTHSQSKPGFVPILLSTNPDRLASPIGTLGSGQILDAYRPYRPHRPGDHRRDGAPDPFPAEEGSVQDRIAPDGDNWRRIERASATDTWNCTWRCKAQGSKIEHDESHERPGGRGASRSTCIHGDAVGLPRNESDHARAARNEAKPVRADAFCEKLVRRRIRKSVTTTRTGVCAWIA